MKISKWIWIGVVAVGLAVVAWYVLAPKTPDLPIGYTIDSYTVEKGTDISCTTNTECETPPEYLIQSRCPFTSLCLKGKCTVVCPQHSSQ